MNIRHAKRSDLPGICRIHLESWRRVYASVLPERFLNMELPADMAGRWQNLPDGEPVLVAESGHMVGFAHIRMADRDGPLLESLHVASGSQGQGVGRRLMHAVAETVLATGQNCLWLEVMEDNIGARRFYAGLDGLEGPVFTYNLVGHSVPAVTVRWNKLNKLLELS